jgi:hypothetical protein
MCALRPEASDQRATAKVENEKWVQKFLKSKLSLSLSALPDGRFQGGKCFVFGGFFGEAEYGFIDLSGKSGIDISVCQL